jgi:MarR family 2-MHQ and catechol resistance regulon transcriptional repressor
MQNDIFRRVAVDLLSIPPLLFREIRRKLIRTTLADIPVDITPIHFEILRLLEEEGTLHVAEIGEKLQIARAQMTQLIDKLVDLNMVERNFDSADRRIINVTITSEGSTVLEERKDSIMSAIQETVSCLTDAELEDLSNSLRKLRDILSKLQ